MSDSESNIDLNKAIALSLKSKYIRPAKPPAEVISLVSDEEDEGDKLHQPQTTSVKYHATKIFPHTSTTSASSSSTARNEAEQGTTSSAGLCALQLEINNSVNKCTFSLSHLDRKAMELERLARAAKRVKEHENEAREPKRRKLASCSIPEADSRDIYSTHKSDLQHIQSDPLKEGSITSQITSLNFSRVIPSSTPLHQLHYDKLKNSVAEGNQSQQSLLRNPSMKAYLPGIQYPEGVIKKTWAKGFPRQGDDITIEEVLQGDDLTLAVLSAFQIDSEWIMGKLGKHTKVIWVLQATTEAIKQNYQSKAPSNFKFCFPSMAGMINCMHSKLQLLAHPDYLRVVVPSANLVPYDWGETGDMENTCFLIDLPRHKLNQSTPTEELTEFFHDLIYFLRAMGLQEQIINSLRKFDFSRTAKFGFVHSIGGPHRGISSMRTGHRGLARAIQNLGLQSREPVRIDFLTASLGKITSKFIQYLYLAAKGELIGNDKDDFEKISTDDINSLCQIYFPTDDTVRKSLGGVNAGGTICFQSKWWKKNGFLDHLLRDCESQRQGMLMHSKMWFVRPRILESHSKPWVYIGSANLSESAWGRLVTDKRTKQPMLNCSNWECGVIFPLSDQNYGVTHPENMGLTIFGEHVPVPMVTPGATYGDRKPWFFSER